MDTTLQIGLIQMDSRPADKKRNLARAEEMLMSLPDGVAVAGLPEFFNTGYSLDLIGDDFFTLAETIPGPTTVFLAEIARERAMAILANIPEADPDQSTVLYDTTFLLDAQGELVGRYRKTHLYPTEHRYFRAGDGIPVLTLDDIRLGTATCFDHAFPEVFSSLAVKGAQIVFIPSAVPTGYEYLLNLRTRARAQDNQYWVAAINRVGAEGDVTYCGLSKVVDPRGEIVAEAPQEGEATLVTEIDLAMIARERKQEPVLRTRRPNLYH